MTYYNDGSGRDSYINFTLKNPAPVTSIAQKKTELPANVYRRLRAEASREQYGVYAYENEKTRNRIMVEKGGKLRVTTDNAELQEEERLRIYEVKMVRKERLKQLYKTEFAGWQQQLGKRGLAVEIHYD